MKSTLSLRAFMHRGGLSSRWRTAPIMLKRPLSDNYVLNRSIVTSTCDAVFVQCEDLARLFDVIHEHKMKPPTTPYLHARLGKGKGKEFIGIPHEHSAYGLGPKHVDGAIFQASRLRPLQGRVCGPPVFQ
jgi:hypothetical protein